jgi:hypothetical protein
MLLTFLPAVSFDAGAVGAPTPGTYWTDAGHYDITTWYSGPGAGSYTVSTNRELAGLAALVNGSATGYAQDSFAGEVVQLIPKNPDGVIDLSEFFWYPIGGVSPISSGVPTGYSFSGTFLGNNAFIEGLYM